MNSTLNSRLHLLLSQSGKAQHKKDLVFSFTAGRSESSRDMTDQEARELITYLENSKTTPSPEERMRRKIISRAHEMGWKTPEGKADIERIDNWCLNYGYLKKKLNQYTYNELPKLVTIFEEKVYKQFLSGL